MANQYRSVLSGGAGGDALPAEVLSGKTFTNDNGPQTGTMVNNGAVAQTVSSGQSYTIPEGYHNGNGTVTGASITPTLLTLPSGAVSFTSEIGKSYIVCKNTRDDATVTISGCTVIATEDIITAVGVTVHTWAVTATDTTISISGASTGDIVVYKLD